jgi:hypothetical protein
MATLQPGIAFIGYPSTKFALVEVHRPSWLGQGRNSLDTGGEELNAKADGD